MEVLALIFPVFAVIVTGYIFARLEVLPQSIAGALTQFVYYTAIPAILFVIIAKQEIKDLANWSFIGVFTLPVIVVFFLMFFGARILRGLSTGNAVMLGMVSVASNTGIIALPLLHELFGEKTVVLAALANVVMVGLILVLIVILETIHSEDEGGLGATLKHLRTAVLNPIVLSTVLGIAYAITPLSLPKLVVDYLDLVASALTPCALFAVGMSIKVSDVIKTGPTIALTSTIKLIVLPILVLLCANLAGLDPLTATAAVIASAVPTGKTMFILSKQYHEYEEVTAETVSATTAVSVITLVGWLIVLSRIFPGSFTLQ
ncbi:MAG: AEC family transporter [Ruegeria sp.]